MKIASGHRSIAAMTRAEFLIVVFVALIGIYLFVRYERTGEILQINWRKPAPKTNSQPENISTPEAPVAGANETPDETSKALAANTYPVTTNFVKRPQSENAVQKTPLMRAGDPTKQRMRIPTNAVSLPYQRRSPGVRIAFP